MATVELAAAAAEDLDALIATLSLPADTRERVARSLRPLKQVPLLGPELEDRWAGMRFLLGPWRWMLMVYVVDARSDRVIVLTIQDARTSRAATARR